MQRYVSLGLSVFVLLALFLAILVNGCGQGTNTPSSTLTNVVATNTVTPNTVQPASSAAASPSASVPALITIPIESNGSTKYGMYLSVAGGPPAFAELDTGSEGLLIEQDYASGVTLTDQQITLDYDHCTHPRTGTVGFASIGLLSNGSVALKTIAPVPVLVVANGVVGTGGNTGFHAIFGIGMTSADGGSVLTSARLFLPEPYNEMYVMDWPENQMTFGRFNPSNFKTVQLPSEPCTMAGTSVPPNPLPCWDDSAVPVSYNIAPAASPGCASPTPPTCAVPSPTVPPNPQTISSLLDSGASSSFQFSTTAVPNWLTVDCNEDVLNNITASVITSGGPVSIPLSSTVAAAGCTACGGSTATGTKVNDGNVLFNDFQILYDHVDGLIGFAQPSPAPSPSPAQPATWNLYAQYAQSYLVPYASPAPVFGSPTITEPEVNIQAFGVNLKKVHLDTGSRGLRITQNLLPSSALPVQGTPGYIFYFSDGIRHNGIWTPAQVTFTDARSSGGAPQSATATVLVLVEQSVQQLPGVWPTAQCNPCPGTSPTPETGPNDPKDAYMGIGFDRTGNGDFPENNDFNQNYNPMLNLDAMRSGTMCSGYILTPQGVQLGLTPANTAMSSSTKSQFAYGKLAPTGLSQVANSPTDWQPAVGSVTINGVTYGVGQGVIDIGIDEFLLTLPGQPSSGNLTGGAVTANLLGLNGLVSYTFDAADSGSTNPLQPASVNWSPIQTQKPWEINQTYFFNTGRNPLNGFNVLYDATNGYLGLQLNNVLGASSALVTPAVSATGVMTFPNGFTTNLPIYLTSDTTFSDAGSATFNAPILGGGNLTLSGGGTFTFACGAYANGGTTVTPGTTLKLGQGCASGP